jgi:predicted polyphosphate/ATP-dependent NAD kinase
MGAMEAAKAGIPSSLLSLPFKEKTTSADTRSAAKQIEDRGAKLLLFAGGDGTARDISETIDARIAALGIPCGVKNYSAVFATSPEAAGEVAASYMIGEIGTVDSEVLDFDEDLMREGKIATRICGLLRIPASKRFMQDAKLASYGLDEEVEKEAIAKFMVEELDPKFQYILGPGSTVAKVASFLGLEKTLLGVDVASEGKLVAKDVTCKELAEIVQKRPTKLIITPIGGQGYILGRGNQQLTPQIIRAIRKENIMLLCTRTKLTNLTQRRFLVDTGEKELDNELRGYWRIIVGYREFAVVKVDR